MQTILSYSNNPLSRCPQLASGTILSVPALGGTVRHFGLSSQYGFIIDKSFARGDVAERPIQEFLNGNDLRIEGYWGVLDPFFVIQNARQRLGERWTLGGNCEHFVRECHGLKPESPQLSHAISGALVGAALLHSRFS